MSNRKLTTARQCCPHCGGELAPAAPRARKRRVRVSRPLPRDYAAELAPQTAAELRAELTYYRATARDHARAGGHDKTALVVTRILHRRMMLLLSAPPAVWRQHPQSAADLRTARDETMRIARRAETPKLRLFFVGRARWYHWHLRAALGLIAAPLPAPEPAPEPPAPEPAFVLAITCDALGWRSEFYPTEETARRGFRVLAGYPSTANLKLFDRASGRLIDEYRRPEPEPVAPEPAPAAPAPVQPPAAPSAPVAPPAPRQPVQRLAEPPANPVLLAWWHDAAASWRAYQSPADHAALTRCQDAIAALLAALPDAGRREPMIRAVKAGRAFPAKWFATERNTG